MKKISRRKFVIASGAAASVAAAGTCMCTKTGRATITGVGTTPAINPESCILFPSIILKAEV